MNIHRCMFIIGLVLCTIDRITASGRISAKRVTAERGSDLYLTCTFREEDSDRTLIQWLYQNQTDPSNTPRSSKIHWRPLFINDQSLTPTETRYSIQQKNQPINASSISFKTILTLARVTDSDEGLYMCKSLSPKTIQMAYQVRVIQSLDIEPKQVRLRTNETTGDQSIELKCILTDNHQGRRQHEIHWWHNNKRLGGPNSRQVRIVRNVTQQSFISTLVYTGPATHLAGKFICESDPIKKEIDVNLTNCSRTVRIQIYTVAIILFSFYLLMK